MKEFIDKLIEELEGVKSIVNSPADIVWNNAVKMCIYKVNEFAEEYNNDFCEWKKTDKSKYSPYYHALKHGNITLEFHDDFKFCPYCGKKIKVVK